MAISCMVGMPFLGMLLLAMLLLAMLLLAMLLMGSLFGCMVIVFVEMNLAVEMFGLTPYRCWTDSGFDAETAVVGKSSLEHCGASRGADGAASGAAARRRARIRTFTKLMIDDSPQDFRVVTTGLQGS